MDFHLPKLKWLLPAMATGAMVLSASAQQAGQPIIFSSPQTSDAQPAASSLAPDNSQPGILPGTLQAPMSLFNFNPPSDHLPLPAAPGISPQQQRLQQLLEERRNWTLMTPEEILGVTATEKMLQPPERDAMGTEKNPTQIERYLERESQWRNGPTNGWQNDRDNSPWNLSHDRDNANPLDAGRDSTAETARSLSQFMNGQPNRNDAANQNGNYGWDVLSQPLPQAATKPDLEQLAAMERFRQLLNPSPVEAAQSSPDSQFFPATKRTVDPFITQPEFVPNPAGASFTPLSSGIARPAGLTPLPGAVTSFLPVAAPAWKPQLAPWLLQGPQPFVMPQPKGF